MREAARDSVFARLEQGSLVREGQLAFAREFTATGPEPFRSHTRWTPLHQLMLLQSGLALVLILACSPDAKEVKNLTGADSKPRPTATAVGIGSELPKTGNAKIDEIGQRLADPNTRGSVSEENIIEWNKARIGQASKEATSEAQKPTPTPTAIQKPDFANDPNLENRELVGYNIFSLESRPTTQATREYLEWNSPKGNKIRGIGWVLKPGDSVKIAENLVVSVKILAQPYVYNGVMVLADAQNGSRSYLFVGNFDKNALTKGVLKIAEDNQSVFTGEPYTFVFATESETELKEKFREDTKGSPKKVDNKVPDNQARNVIPSYPPK